MGTRIRYVEKSVGPMLMELRNLKLLNKPYEKDQKRAFL